jgi:hypothetical protein
VDYIWPGTGEDIGNGVPFLLFQQSNTTSLDLLLILENGFTTTAEHTVAISILDEGYVLKSDYLPTDAATKSFVEEKIAAIEIPEGGGGSSSDASELLEDVMEPQELLPETTFTNGYQEAFGAFLDVIPVDASVMEAWVANTNPVTVVYDGEEYTCTPQVLTGSDGNDGVCVGNLSAFGGTGNGEPFAVVQYLIGGTPGFLVGSTVDTAPTEHTVAIDLQVATQKIKEEYIPNDITVSWDNVINKPSGGGSSAEQVQADWNENDENSVSYIKNRPFGMGAEVLTEILPEVTLPFTMTNMGGFGFEAPTTSEQLEAWNTNWSLCRVVYDGVTYDCEPQTLMGIKCCGNIEAFMGTGTNNMPFVFVVGDLYGTGDIAGIYALADTADSTHSIAVSLTLQEVNKLDPKFIENIDYETKIVNKPFGVIAAGAIVADETITFAGEISAMSTINANNIFVGAQYSVVINGSQYSGVGQVIGDGVIGVMVGNFGAILPAYNGFIAFDETMFTVGSEYTITATLAEDFVKKIDEQYLPDNIGGGSGLPESTTTDSGKVLTVGTDGTAAWQTPASGLPEVTVTDDGKFLRVVDGAWAAVTLTDVSTEGA